jgi:hypothetical protein
MKLLTYVIAISFPLLIATSCNRNAKTSEQRKKDKDAMEEFTKTNREIQAEQAKQLESDQGIGLDNSGVDKVIEASKKLEGASTGDQAKMARVARIFAEDVQKDMASLTKHEKGLEEAMDYASVQAPEDLDSRSKKVRVYQKANKVLTNKINSGWHQTIRGNLEKEDLPKQAVADFMKGAKKTLDRQRPLLLIIRKADNDLCEAILAHHAILKKHFGKWQWDSEELAPVFEEDSALKAYNKHYEKIQVAGKKQYEAQQKLLKQQ